MQLKVKICMHEIEATPQKWHGIPSEWEREKERADFPQPDL